MSEAAVPLLEPLDRAGSVPRWKADLALVVAAFFFGTTFVVVQDAVDEVAPMPFLTVRFLLAAGLLAVVARRRRATPNERLHGIAAGVVLWIGYVVQTVGLQYTTAATSAFLTYLLVVFVPLIAFVALGRRPHPATIAGIGLSVVGLLLLTGMVGGNGDATTGFGRGEILTLLCAVAFALHIVILGEVAGRHDTIRFTMIQLLTVGALSAVVSAGDRVVAGMRDGTDASLTDGFHFGATALAGAAFTGIFATAVAFLGMVWAQRVVSATRAALILLLEPVFAAGLAWLTGDGLSATAALGGGLILVAVVVAEVVPRTLDPTVKIRSR